jgi:hypothetical protein
VGSCGSLLREASICSANAAPNRNLKKGRDAFFEQFNLDFYRQR